MPLNNKRVVRCCIRYTNSDVSGCYTQFTNNDVVVVHGSPIVMLLLVVVHGSPIVMLLLVVAAVNHLLTLVEEDEDLSPELYEPGLSAFAELLMEEDKMNVRVALADGLVLVV